MKTKITIVGIAVGIAVGTTGCVRETTKQELLGISRQAQMNTIVTTIFYTGSDDNYDYFYLDIPFARNDACKVPRPEDSVTNRMAVTQQRTSWRVFAPFPTVPLTNAITIQDGTNTLITIPGLNIQDERKSEQGGGHVR